MRIYVEPPRSQIARDLFVPLEASLRELGHDLTEERADMGPGSWRLAIVWNGRGSSELPPGDPRKRFDPRGRALFCCENGWLPRSAYQIGLGGFNANHHAAPWRWTGPLSDEEAGDLDEYLEMLRTTASGGAYVSTDPTGEPAGPGEPFLLAPFQMPQDVNMTTAPQGMRTPYSFARAVLDAKPPWRVVFKQHPMDANHGNSQLDLPGLDVWPHSRANVHQLLKSEHCRGVVTLNSNVAHDALLWGVPVIVLGKGMWPQPRGGPVPFWAGLLRSEGEWERFSGDRDGRRPPGGARDQFPEILGSRAARQTYAHWLIRQQWKPGPRTALEGRLMRDPGSPEDVAELLEVAG